MSTYQNLVEALADAPVERPFVTHWIDEDEYETVSFSEFRRRSRVQAAFLRAKGVGAGDRVVIIMPQGIAAMTAFVGAMMLGAVPAILAYPNFKVEAAKYRSGLAGVTANLRARVVLIDGNFSHEVLGSVSLGDGAELLRAPADGEELSETEIARPRGEEVAFIQHSAGTTGLQKGVALTHAAVLRQIEHLRAALRIDGASDRIYSWLPLYHDMGLIACFVLPLVLHVPVVMQSPLEWVMQPEGMLQVVSQFRCTLAWMPNFAFQFVPRRVPQDRWPDYDLSSLRALINCSEPVRTRSMDEFANAFAVCRFRREALHASYAMAENVFAITQTDLSSGPRRIFVSGSTFRKEHRVIELAADHPDALSLLSSGKLLPTNHVQIVDDSGLLLADAKLGEIMIQSDTLMSGYYNRPDLTEAVMVDGWYRTGDLGFLLGDELFVVGRKKDLLIIGGENLYPQDIEEAVSAHPAIHDGRVIALGIFNSELGTEQLAIVAEVEADASDTDLEGELRKIVVATTGVSPQLIFLKPRNWIVKSTAGKPARTTTREKLLREHPDLKQGEQL